MDVATLSDHVACGISNGVLALAGAVGLGLAGCLRFGSGSSARSQGMCVCVRGWTVAFVIHARYTCVSTDWWIFFLLVVDRLLCVLVWRAQVVGYLCDGRAGKVSRVC